MEQEIISRLIEGGVAVILLILGIKWLNKDRASILASYSEERNKRIEILEQASEVCNRDRAILHEQMASLQTEVRKLYQMMLEHADKGKCDAGCIKEKK